MRNIIKLNVFFLVFYIIFSSHTIASDKILPLPKPTLDKETKKIIAKKKNIYPKKKPSEENQPLIETPEETEQVSDIVEKEEVFIYPKKKPILVQKKIEKVAAKSEILSKKDFKIARAAFEYKIKKNGRQH